MLQDVLDPSPAAALQQLQHLLELLECWLPFGCTSTPPHAKNCKLLNWTNWSSTFPVYLTAVVLSRLPAASW